MNVRVLSSRRSEEDAASPGPPAVARLSPPTKPAVDTADRNKDRGGKPRVYGVSTVATALAVLAAAAAADDNERSVGGAAAWDDGREGEAAPEHFVTRDATASVAAGEEKARGATLASAEGFPFARPSDVDLAALLRRAAEAIERGDVSINTNLLCRRAMQAFETEVSCEGGDKPGASNDFTRVFGEDGRSSTDRLPVAHGEAVFDPKSKGNERAIRQVLGYVGSDRSASKMKADLSNFIMFAGRVMTKWKQDGDDGALPRAARAIPGAPGELHPPSVRAFAEYLKKNEPEEEQLERAALKYKFTQWDRIAWVLESVKSFGSADEVARLLIICSVTRRERGKYKPRKKKVGDDEPA